MEHGMPVGGEMYDAGNDVDDKFPEEFRKHVKDENLLCWKYQDSCAASWVYGSDLYVFQKAHSPDDGVTSGLSRLVDSLISFFKRNDFCGREFLVQFWAAEQVVNSVDDITSDNNYRLTTRNHPFLLGDFWLLEPENERLFHYRMKTCDVIVSGDGGGGAIGRVFRNKRIEYTPYVAHSSSEEYPLRYVALSCRIQCSLVVPWFDSYGKVVGVIEFVSPRNPKCFAKVLNYFNEYLSSSLRKMESFVRVRRKNLEDRFPEDFRKFVQKENLLCWEYTRIRREMYDVGTDFYEFQKAHTLPESHSLLDSLISFFQRDHFRGWNYLVQFWAAEVVNSVDNISDTNYRLTTRNHPFLLRDFRVLRPLHEGLCRYRMKTCNVSVTGDGGGGAIGLVFRNERIEYTPNVGYYSFEEYPIRDVALSCHIKHSIVVPWFDSYGKVVGVIEFVSPQNPDCFAEVLKYFNQYLSSSLKEREMEIESFVRVRPEIYDAGNDFKHKFPEDFRNYVKRENLRCLEYRRIGLEIYDVGTDFYVFEKAQTWDHIRVHSKCQSLVKRLISFFKRDHFRVWNLLVQFWAVEEVVNSVDDTNYRLTTHSLPFLLGNIRSWNPEHEGLCRYRMKTHDVSVAGDGGGGVIGHVFRNKRIEYTSNVGYFSSEVYPLRDVALSCHINHSIVVPWFDSYRKVVGVIEFVSPQNPNCFEEVLKYFNEYLSSSLKMTIEATYGDRLIRFQLSPSSGIHELSHQLSQRLGLVDETYDLKYPDEQNDHIELLCDEDLQLYISESVNNEIFTLKVLIVPK